MIDPDETAAMIDQLPFFVTGALSPADSARIEAALPSSPQLREELAATSGLFALVKEQGAALVAGAGVSEGRLESLIDRIEAEAKGERRVPKPCGTSGVMDWWQGLSAWRWTPALAMSLAAVVAIQAGVIATMIGVKDNAGYVTASGPGESAQSGTLFVVRLAPEARWADVAALLDREDLQVIDGPREGMLTIGTRVPRTTSEADSLRNRLRASPVIAFVGNVG